MTLARSSLRKPVLINRIGGERAFRRRLMELGLTPGTQVEAVGVAPLGDPIELLVRGSSLSIRRSEAEQVAVTALEPERAPAKLDPTELNEAAVPSVP